MSFSDNVKGKHCHELCEIPRLTLVKISIMPLESFIFLRNNYNMLLIPQLEPISSQILKHFVHENASIQLQCLWLPLESAATNIEITKKLTMMHPNHVMWIPRLPLLKISIMQFYRGKGGPMQSRPQILYSNISRLPAL